MKHIVIGTAGHVDHGKTCLTKALTGVDTDRLKEEQKRGITIQIGFAQLVLPNGMTASIVDVPGHEKLIRNMLTGATGIDVVLMVIAADEGCMPQTKEHLDILSMLKVKNGIIVITKCDMVDEEWLEVVKDDIAEAVQGTFLENAPMVPVSSYTGQGIDELKEKIVEMVETSPARTTDKPFRLPVDRVFSVKGFGTVVTGTLIDGTLHPGDEVTIYPDGKTAKVRELQNHDVKQDEVEAGMRVAINLAGIDKDEIEKGCTIAQPDSMLITDQITVKLELTKDSPFVVKNYSFLHFYEGTQEKVCKVRLLDRNELLPGETCYAQFNFKDDTIVARNLDRFIVRFFSPMTTVGGGIILDMKKRRLKRNDPDTIARLDRLDSEPKERVFQMIDDAGYELIKEDELLSLSGLSAKQVHTAIQQVQQSGETVKIKGAYITKKTLDTQWNRVEELLKKHHEEHSLMEGMRLGELRERAFAKATGNADAVLSYFADKGKLRIDGNTVALASFQTNFSDEQVTMQKDLEDYFLKCGVEAPLNKDTMEIFGLKQKLCKQVMTRMIKDGILVALNPNVTVHAKYCKQAFDLFVSMFENSDTVAIGDFRTAFGVSRKFAQMYLDYFDVCRASKLVGDSRVLLKKSLK
ncbi:MAG: selenocysteine-specific translation elongation factor [Eubacteriales bacterium]|nr:selenocysteine-specific translation elongation factor [Eubacteriales bacterium]